MASVDAGRSRRQEGEIGPGWLRVDQAGRVWLDPAATGRPVGLVAEGICADLEGLIGVDAAAVVVRSVPGEDGAFGGLVTISEERNGDRAFSTATAVGRSEVHAIAMATLAALGGTDDLLSMYASRLAAGGAVAGVTVADVTGVRFHGGQPAAEDHLALVGALPAPGRLTVATAGWEHRVLCLPEAAVVVSVVAGGAAAQIDVTLGRIEASVYERVGSGD